MEPQPSRRYSRPDPPAAAMPVRIGPAPPEEPRGDELQPALFAAPRNDATTAARGLPRAGPAVGRPLAQPGWDLQRLTEDVQRRGLAGDRGPARLGWAVTWRRRAMPRRPRTRRQGQDGAVISVAAAQRRG
jgi:hypothetical protein